MLPPHHSPARYVAMKDSWSHGDDRRDRGRVDRGVTRLPRSRSPTSRRGRLESDREVKARDRSPVRSRPISQHGDRPRDRSHDRRRRPSRSPIRDSREEVRERNRGRELLDTRGSDKPKRTSTHQSPSSGKRRKSRSPSPPRSHHKKSRRGTSRSPSRLEGGSTSSARPDKRRRSLSPLPPRKRSPDRRTSEIRAEGKSKHYRDTSPFERRGRSPSPRKDRYEFDRQASAHQHEKPAKRNTTPPRQSQKPRERSPFERVKENQQPRERSPFDRFKGKEPRREQSQQAGRKSPDNDPYESLDRSRPSSPPAPRGPKSSRGSSPKRDRGGRGSRDEYRPGKPKPRGGRSSFAAASGANSIEVKSRASVAASGANSIEVKSDKMAGRGFYGGQQGYNPNQQMQAAFPLKPQYNQGPPQVDPRQYSQSPQHQMTPGSYHGSHSSPTQSPYSAGRGNWGGQQAPQQYSPQP
jgi:CTD kinase subunit alpha